MSPDEQASEELFVDTSAIIAHLVGHPEVRRVVASQLQAADRVVTGLVVRQELKRRFLDAVRFVYERLLEASNYHEAYRVAKDALATWQKRKLSLAVDLLVTYATEAGDLTQSELRKHVLFRLEALLDDAWDLLHEVVDEVLRGSGCAFGQEPPKRDGATWKLGRRKCSLAGEACTIADFLVIRRSAAERILARLEEQAPTEELADAREFLVAVLPEPGLCRERSPCLTVGDLLIALESADVPTFCTLNGAESLHLCAALGQRLVLCPARPGKAPEIHDFSAC